MLSRAQNIFHHMLNVFFARACAGPFLVFSKRIGPDNIENYILNYCLPRLTRSARDKSFHSELPVVRDNVGYKYSKTCLKRSLKKKEKMVFKTDNRLMQVKSTFI